MGRTCLDDPRQRMAIGHRPPISAWPREAGDAPAARGVATELVQASLILERNRRCMFAAAISASAMRSFVRRGGVELSAAARISASAAAVAAGTRTSTACRGGGVVCRCVHTVVEVREQRVVDLLSGASSHERYASFGAGIGAEIREASRSSGGCGPHGRVRTGWRRGTSRPCRPATAMVRRPPTVHTVVPARVRPGEAHCARCAGEGERPHAAVGRRCDR